MHEVKTYRGMINDPKCDGIFIPEADSKGGYITFAHPWYHLRAWLFWFLCPYWKTTLIVDSFHFGVDCMIRAYFISHTKIVDNKFDVKWVSNSKSHHLA